MRRHYIDNIRWTAVLLVILCHTFVYYVMYFPCPEMISQIEMLIPYFLYPWLMPMMFLVAGMSSRWNIEQKGELIFLKQRFLKLLIPGVIGCVIFHWIAGYFYISEGDVIYGVNSFSHVGIIQQYGLCVWNGRGVLWFIQLLFIFSIFILGIRLLEKDVLYRWINKHIPHPMVTIIGGFLLTWGAALCLSDTASPWLIRNKPIGYFMWYILGYYIFSHEEVIDKLKEIRTPIIIAAILGVEFLWITIFGENVDNPIYFKSFAFNLSGWLTSLTILVIYKSWVNRSNKITECLCKSSYGWYIMQNFTFAIGGYLIAKYSTLPMWANYLCMGGFLFIGSPLLYEIVKRIPGLRFVLLGIDKNASGK